MQHQPQPIIGYRELTPREVDLINDLKRIGEELSAKCDELRAEPEVDQRWLSIGITQLQQGLMAVVRSVAKPTTF